MAVINEGNHISQQFTQELTEVKSSVLEMGGAVERQLRLAVEAVMNADSGGAQQVVESDREVNRMEVQIDAECTRILARRQPAASDLRLVVAVSKMISDLERVGDEAAKIARQAIALTEQGEAPRGYVEVRHIGQQVSAMLSDALDAFARLDVEAAVAVAQRDKEVDMEYHTAMRALMTYMMEDPRSISRVMNVMSVLRSLERVGDHSRNLCEHVVYLVKGLNVRHLDLQELEATIRRSN